MSGNKEPHTKKSFTHILVHLYKILAFASRQQHKKAHFLLKKQKFTFQIYLILNQQVNDADPKYLVHVKPKRQCQQCCIPPEIGKYPK